MKFMIVDDEPIVREGLKTLIDWSEIGFTLCDEASDGIEAVTKILDQNPDLVILDIRMPELSGIEVVETIRKKGYCGKIIILSGFSDFTYAQTAIQHGVESYLLKPVDEDELIAALTRVRNRIEQENILEIYSNKNLNDAKNMLLKHLITGSIPCGRQKFDSYGLSLNIRPFQLVMLEYFHYNDINIGSLHDYWRKIYPDCNSEFVIIENFIVILIKGSLSIQYFSDHVSSYMIKTAQDMMQEPLIIISDTFNEVSSFPEIYQKLKSISNRKFFYNEKNRPIFCKNLEFEKDILHYEKFSPIEFIESVYKVVLNKDTSPIDLIIKRFCHVLQNSNFTIEQTFQVLINCILQLKTLFNETYIKELAEFSETKLINEICNCNSLNEIMYLLNDEFTLFCDYIKKPSEVNTIEKVLNYIDIHLNEDLKLEKIAELFSYHPAYLGRLLSNRIGTNFNLYIEKKRLDKAIDMLVNTDVKIPDISILIGYQNVEYFYRKFKKYTSFTPGNFRVHHCYKDNENRVNLM